jgi:hypothetical protein
MVRHDQTPEQAPPRAAQWSAIPAGSSGDPTARHVQYSVWYHIEALPIVW